MRLAPISDRPDARSVAWRCWLAVAVWLALNGCNRSADVTPTPVAPPPVIGAATPVPAGPELVPAARQLVVWLPPFGSPLDDDRAGVVFADAFRLFERTHPGVDVDAHVKAERGAASLLAYLRSAQRVAPAILPDLVLINTKELWQAADLGLVPALGPDEARGDSFYAFAPAAVTYRNQVFGFPYAVDIVQAVYDPARLPTAPRTWKEFLTGDSQLLFPTGAESEATLVTLLHYVGAGGRLVEDGTLADPTALRAVFEFIVAAQAAGLIPPAVVDLGTYEAVWRTQHAVGPETVSLVITGYHDAVTAGGDLMLAPVPTRDGSVVTVAATWAFAVLAHEEDRRRLALALVDELLAADVQGNWSRQAQRLPSRPAAFAVWPTDALTGYLDRQLTAAVALPNGRAFADLAGDIQVAQNELLRGYLSVDEALQVVATRP